jgi:hypothetical protein
MDDAMDPVDRLAREEQRDRVKKLVMLRALVWEEETGRPPTDEELERLAFQAEDGMRYWTARTGALAQAQAAAGRPLTLEEQAEIEQSVWRDWAERLPE